MIVILTPWRRLAIGAGAALLLTLTGVVGYIITADFSFFDALYQTVTTITTAGFGEIHPLPRGARILTLVLVVLGVIVILYVLTAVMQIAVEGELENLLGVRRMKGKIEALRSHYILCGYGRVGQEIAREFSERRLAFVVIELNPEALERVRHDGHLYIEGDATQDAILEQAGVHRARALLAASDSDAGNTYIVLTAKALNPGLLVVARVGHPQTEARMRRAGADRVISPYTFGGRRMALSALQPSVVDFIDLLASPREGEHILAEVVVGANSAVRGRPLQEPLQACPQTTLLAVQRQSGEILVGPGGAYVPVVGDRLMVLSNEHDLQVLGRTLTAGEPASA